MLSTFGTCNIRAGTAAKKYSLRYPGRDHSDANVFRRLERSVTPTAHVNAGRPQTLRIPANEHVIIAAVERKSWGSSHDIDEPFLHNPIDRRSIFTREGVFNIHNSHLSARDNPHALLEQARPAYKNSIHRKCVIPLFL
jgi:hypothetical protein